jgi:hypothetical protein
MERYQNRLEYGMLSEDKFYSFISYSWRQIYTWGIKRKTKQTDKDGKLVVFIRWKDACTYIEIAQEGWSFIRTLNYSHLIQKIEGITKSWLDSDKSSII